MIIGYYKKSKNYEVGKDGVIEIVGFVGAKERFARIYFNDGRVLFENGTPADKTEFDANIFEKHNIKI